ncbi:GNAT family N-acetyltransferase [Stenotrophomonas sp. CFBP 13718]|uniref:GNAT family N-acetyltransferase n=1 Tax=Stenotrophomonas sp. CFBP 13718 TaxID=2775304 RepID=UPI0017815134|nr:GNAT family N-acetyltransferase [Stenotrophomonas sp. CFBP 13718]MBD8696623.1 GNAT family N-acetyltransferase [Stenotrophomonas sp. CFBP 13718]
MSVRALAPHDFEAASAICIAAFTQSVAPTVTAQGVATFGSIAAASSFAKRFVGDNKILVFEEAGRVVGVIELKEGRHISMLFVDPDAQGRGIGRQLVEAALAQARAELITVSASLPSVPAYTRYGFALAGPVAEAAGLIYQPMNRALAA